MKGHIMAVYSFYIQKTNSCSYILYMKCLFIYLTCVFYTRKPPKNCLTHNNKSSQRQKLQRQTMHNIMKREWMQNVAKWLEKEKEWVRMLHTALTHAYNNKIKRSSQHQWYLLIHILSSLQFCKLTDFLSVNA